MPPFMECFTLCSLVHRPPFGVLICCCLLYLPYLFLYNYIATNLVIRSPFYTLYILLGNYCYSSNNKQLMIIFCICYTSITQHAHVCTCTYLLLSMCLYLSISSGVILVVVLNLAWFTKKTTWLK